MDATAEEAGPPPHTPARGRHARHRLPGHTRHTRTLKSTWRPLLHPPCRLLPHHSLSIGACQHHITHTIHTQKHPPPSPHLTSHPLLPTNTLLLPAPRPTSTPLCPTPPARSTPPGLCTRPVSFSRPRSLCRPPCPKAVLRQRTSCINDTTPPPPPHQRTPRSLDSAIQRTTRRAAAAWNPVRTASAQATCARAPAPTPALVQLGRHLSSLDHRRSHHNVLCLHYHHHRTRRHPCLIDKPSVASPPHPHSLEPSFSLLPPSASP